MALVPQKSPPSRARRAVLFGLLAVAYLYVFPYQDRTNNPNENIRFYMTAAIVDDHTFALDHVRQEWGWVNDGALYQGHSYSVKAPGTSYLGVPGYWLYRQWCNRTGHALDRTTALWVCRFTASVLPMLWFLYAFHRWLAQRGGPPVLRDAIVLSLGVGSMLYAYGMLFVSHTSSAIAAFASFMILERARRDETITGWRAISAGFLAASVTAFEYPGFFTTALLCLYALFAIKKRSYLVNFAFGAAIPTLSVLGFHQACFDNPFTPGHRYLEAEAFRGLANQGFYGSGTFQPDAAGGLLFDLGYGLFPLTPILILAFVGFPVLLREKKTRLDAIFALAIPVATYLLICTMNNWRGGWTVGPRYLAVGYPFLAWGAFEGGRVIARKWPRGLGAFAVASLTVGLLASGAPSIYYPHLPEGITRPLPQLIRVLVIGGFAPYNAGSYFAAQWGRDFHGTASMIPIMVVALLLVAFAAWGEKKLKDRLAVLLVSFVWSSFLFAPLVAQDSNAVSAAAATGNLLSYWDPSGFDRASRIEQRIREGTASDEDYRALPRLYEVEGRPSEARSAERRRDAHFQPAPPPTPERAPVPLPFPALDTALGRAGAPD
ncbi:MAG: hypothetical protein U0234_05990 [Sandaracinus sp.]